MSLSPVRHLCGFWGNMFNPTNIEIILGLALPLLLLFFAAAAFAASVNGLRMIWLIEGLMRQDVSSGGIVHFGHGRDVLDEMETSSVSK